MIGGSKCQNWGGPFSVAWSRTWFFNPNSGARESVTVFNTGLKEVFDQFPPIQKVRISGACHHSIAIYHYSDHVFTRRLQEMNMY